MVKIAKSNNYLYIFLLVVFLLLVIFLKSFYPDLLGGISRLKYQSPLAHDQALLKDIKITYSPSPSVVPTMIISPTASPTPTLSPEKQLSGYCLKVPVIMYHHVQPVASAKEKNQASISVDNGVFDQQMSYLASSGYSTLSSEQLVNALISKTSLPAKSVIITLDDGYRDIYDYAYPIFQKYHITANLMIPTGLMEGPDYLTWGQIEEMGRSGLIYFTDHTWSHYSMGRGNEEKIKYEVNTARNQLQQHLGKTINIFTYPYGSITDTAIRILQNEGFIGAFSTIGGFWQCDSFIMTLHRNRIGNAPLSSYGL